MKNKLILIFLIACSSVVYGQTDKLAVFSVNYPDNASGVIVRWIGQEIRYPEGVSIYRKESSGDWVLLTNTPLLMPEQLGDEFSESQKGDFEAIKSMTDEEFEESFTPIFTLIESVKDYKFALGMGLAYHDKTAQVGKNYIYKVEANNKGNIIKGESLPILVKNFTTIPAPENFRAVRKLNSIQVFWEADSYSHYTYDLYFKKNNDTGWINLAEEMVSASLDNKKPHFKISSDKDTVYMLKLRGMDFFGNYTKDTVLVVSLEDVTPPLPPNLTIDSKDRKSEIHIFWYTSDSDISEYNLYRAKGDNTDSLYTKVNENPLTVNDTTYIDKLTQAGSFFYKLEVIDTAGNKSFSPAELTEIVDVVAPSIPEKLEVLIDTGLMTFSWEGCKEGDLLGYKIYKAIDYKDGKKLQFVQITEVLDTNYYQLVMNKKLNSKFAFAVKSIDTNLNISKSSNLVYAKLPDATPPSAPFLKKYYEEKNSLAIYWMKNTETDLAGYNLFKRKKGDTGKFNQVNINLIPNSIQVYLDKEAPRGVFMEYYLQAIDKSGLISKKSNVILAKLDYKKMDGEIKIDHVFKKSKKQLTLEWNLDSLVNEPIVGSAVYKSTKGKFPLPITEVTKNNTYKEKMSDSGIYEYHVRVYGERGTVLKSITINIIIE